ncbi:MAG: restriction endonuclease [Oscillospiraceae bacterium]|nr:restriction endonuclease [Oscillospiraceae bacterium]
MNQLYYGDNLEIMRNEIPDKSVDLCYIDPPFNSKRDYNQIYNNIGKEDAAQSRAFVDTWTWTLRVENEFQEICINDKGIFTAQTSDLIIGIAKILPRGSLLAYIISMTLRINEIHRVLKSSGSFYLHCDPNVSHYLKLVLDAIFCGQGGDFRNEIIWCYSGGGVSKNWFARKHDVILFYVKTKSPIFNQQFRPYSEGTLKRGRTQIKGKHYEQGLRKEGTPVNDWWTDCPKITSPTDPEKLGYPTQKPLVLLERIVKASSNEGDVVLDCFCGCGTTVSAAQKLNRKWIGIDITYQSISLIKKRLTETYGKDIMKSVKIGGIPKDLESAKALATKEDDRLRKEFEKWAILTYSENKAMVNDKKGKDGGSDGKIRVAENHDGKSVYRDLLFEVKSGGVGVKDIRNFARVVERENAVAGVFITLLEPTKDMKQEAASMGDYDSGYMKFPKIKIVTIAEMMAGERLNVPLAIDVVKTAKASSVEDGQLEIE